LPPREEGDLPNFGTLGVEGDLLIAATEPLGIPLKGGKTASGSEGERILEAPPLLEEDLEDRLDALPQVTLNAPFASASKTLLVMDRFSGEILWSREARYGFRHNALAAGGGRIYCLDRMSDEKLALLGRRGLNFRHEPVLLALDARTGRLVWRQDEGVFGTWLSYSREHDILLQAGSRFSDRAADEAGKGMSAYSGADGSLLWRLDASYGGPPILYHDRIITQAAGGNTKTHPARVFHLESGEEVMRTHPLTGHAVPWSWIRYYGCNTAVASENLLTFRSASAAFVDLTRGQGTANLGGFRSGCTSNLVVADGVLNAPDYTRTCTCAYQNQSSLALVHMPQIEYWTVDHYPPPEQPTAVMQVGINLGAPGNRFADSGVLWLEYPSVAGPSPDLPVWIEGDDLKKFRYHNTRIEGAPNWVAASGMEGVRRVTLRMFLQPGDLARSLEGFENHAGRTTLWSRKEVQGRFDDPTAYTVRLYFAEVEHKGTGQRVFDVLLQGEEVLGELDIAKEAGGINRTLVKEFRNIELLDDLIVSFRPRKGTPLLCGLEVRKN
jgi:outer membrane protein assembly factor BamB